MHPDKLTIKSQEALQRADGEAAERGNQAIEAQHLLKAMLADEESLARELLAKLGVNLGNLEKSLELEIDRFPKVSGEGAAQRYVSRGLSAVLDAKTDKNACLNTESVSGLSNITNGSFGIESGSLDVLVSSGEWHHLVAVRDAAGGQIHVYVDGALGSSASVNYTGGFHSATAAVNSGWLNSYTVPNYYRFNGVIDEVAVYGRALTPAEISQHYHDGVIGLRLGYCGCASQVRIMPLGDSITAGDRSACTEPNILTGFRKPLDQSLTNGSYYFDFVGGLQYGSLTFPPVWDIDHEGHMGFRANGPNPSFSIAPNVSGYLAANPADVVLLHIGTNDISDGDDSTTVVDDVATILDNIDAYRQDITVVLARIISRTDGKAAQTSQFNADLAAMAASRIANGDKIIVVDQEVALTYPDDLADTLHPNDVGYGKMAAVWMGALEQFLPVCSQAVPQILSTPRTPCSISMVVAPTSLAICITSWR